MSKVADAICEIQELACEMGDNFGFDPQTVIDIAKALSYPISFVQEALSIEYLEEEVE